MARRLDEGEEGYCSHEYLPEEDGTVYRCERSYKDFILFELDGHVYCEQHLPEDDEGIDS